jgi:hypothetical protein
MSGRPFRSRGCWSGLSREGGSAALTQIQRLDVQPFHMKASKQVTFVLFALLAAPIIAGCTASARSGASSTMTSAGQQQGESPMDSPLNQPLMATGGDLVILRAAPRVIAGVTSGC